ncbi:MAG: hypothetical protein ACI90Y_002177 [Polaromonas sp.]|jgi:hypothetical protein
MKFLKRLISVIVILGAAFIGGAYLLPQEVTISRSVMIEAAPDAIFPHVNSMQSTEGWSPWLSRDPEVQLAYSGPEMGVGNTLEWQSDEPAVGNGRQEIVVSVENELVETALDFGDMGTAKAAFILEGSGGSTEVTWTLVSDMGTNPVGRYMGLMMDRWVGADYEAGLENLKALVESGA